MRATEMGTLQSERHAVITGASSGIGRALALRLGEMGVGTTLVGRDEAALESVRRRLAGLSAPADVLVADLTRPDGVAAVEARLRDPYPPTFYLMNCAGAGTAGYFPDLPVENELDLMRLNCIATLQLTHAAVSTMISRGEGTVLNFSSLAALAPQPYNATYGATKSFVLRFSQALDEELRGSGVRVKTLCPGFTRTNFHASIPVAVAAVPARLWSTPEAVAEAALAALSGRRAVSYVGFDNTVFAFALRTTPSSLSARVAKLLYQRADRRAAAARPPQTSGPSGRT